MKRLIILLPLLTILIGQAFGQQFEVKHKKNCAQKEGHYALVSYDHNQTNHDQVNKELAQKIKSRATEDAKNIINFFAFVAVVVILLLALFFLLKHGGSGDSISGYSNGAL